QERRLHLVQAAVDAGHLVAIAIALAAVAEAPQARRRLGILDHDRPAVPEGAEVLGRIEGERADPAEGAHRPSLVPGPDGLAGVFDERDPALARHLDHG